MRIAVSGTHRNGKTTLVEAFASAHPDFEVEPEPYDRSPFDFLAYVVASEERRLDSFPVGPDLAELAVRGLNHLDLVVWLPLRPGAEATARRSFRRLLDSQLADIIGSDGLGLLSGRKSPRILELRGPTSKRLAGLTAGLERSATLLAVTFLVACGGEPSTTWQVERQEVGDTTTVLAEDISPTLSPTSGWR